MNSHLRSYSLRLQTLAPVFIGSGQEISKKEYVYISRGQRVLIIDTVKFSRILSSKNLLDDYSDFILSSQNDLYRWLQAKKFSEAEIASCTAYQIHAEDALTPDNPLRGIQLFIKDHYAMPYIPGSSLKGAIRTAILAKILAGNQQQGKSHIRSFADTIKNERSIRKNTLQRETAALEAQCLHTLKLSAEIPRSNVLNSLMRGLQISDSEPIASSELILTAKTDLNPVGMLKARPIFRECLRPGVSIKCILSLDPLMLATAGIDMEFIKSAIKEFAAMQEEYFFSSFKLPLNADQSKVDDGMEIYLGGGAGYVSKTIAYPMAGREAVGFIADLLSKQFPIHKHERDKTSGVSPHVLKGGYYKQKFYKMGRCAVEII